MFKICYVLYVLWHFEKFVEIKLKIISLVLIETGSVKCIIKEKKNKKESLSEVKV